MASLATALKEEISTLARREVRRQTAPADKAAARCARDIAALKREVQALERDLASVGTPPPGTTVPPKKTSGRTPSGRRAARRVSTASASAKPRRSPFPGEALKAHRQRLGLSAENYGKLLGASGLSVYNWEQGKTHPRKNSIDAWTEFRRIGKREAAKRLASLKAAVPKSDLKQTPAEK